MSHQENESRLQSVIEPVLATGRPNSEKYYTVAEVAELWKLSLDKVRRLFQDEPGVLVFENPGLISKRRYRTLRIPASVLERVYRRHLNP
jgi:transcriptional regulator GlxA family with amidase domain